MAIPNGVIKICAGVPLSNDYKHALWFNNDTLMFNYFESKVVKTYSNYNIVRDTLAINVQATLDMARSWNYMYFQHNGSAGGKIYFAFITRVEYVNENTCRLYYEIDVMTTYMWQYELKQCFVEREHSTSDKFYEHLIDEGLEVGEYIDDSTFYVELQDLAVLVMSSVVLKGHYSSNPFTRVTGYKLCNTYSSMAIYAVDLDHINVLNTKLNLLNEAGRDDAIISMWMYPKTLIDIGDQSWSSEDVVSVRNTKELSFDCVISDDFNGYVPRNKKLYTFPYCFTYITNNAGASAVYKHELKRGEETTGNNPSTLTFTVAGAFSPESSVRLYPNYYKKAGGNFEEGLTLGVYPMCAWNSDSYKMWLAQNQNQLETSQQNTIISAGAGIATGVGMALTGNVGGGLATAVGSGLAGYMQISSLLAQKADKAVQAPNAYGRYTGNINIAQGYQTFTISRRNITANNAKIIDDYFTRFGYACRRIKVPNRHARKSFTYVKTIDCQVTGNLSHDIIQKIESVYDNGVTFWADPSVVGVYTSDNSCL